MATAAVMAQKKSVINLISSTSIQGVKLNGVDLLKVYGGVFQQDYSTLRSDSAYFYQAQNAFDAFGHVVITQGDTLHIYSDKLNYNGNTKIAILTNHVQLVDKDATLSTDYMTYNTATKYGTYTGGGKLVNKDNTLTSMNGYYFANSRDSYFRYNVVLLTPDALIKTDTLRYNTGSRIAYFYGPTHIYGKKSGKDNDTLYTENGTYNTITEQAFFGKKNLYSQGTKTLKGDSMFYDRKKGYGRAVKNITFNDNEQKMTLKGDLGVYYKTDERAVVTENAYGIIVTEERDTTKKDTVEKKAEDIIPKNSKKLAGDTVKKTVAKPASVVSNRPKNTVIANKPVTPPKPTIVKGSPITKKDTTASRKKQKVLDKEKSQDKPPLKKDSLKIKRDSIYMTGDTLETKISTYKAYKELLEKIRLSQIKDTTIKKQSIVYTKPVKFIELAAPKWVQDSTYLHRDLFGKPKEKPKKKATQEVNIKKTTKQDSLKKVINKVDSVYLTRKVELSDTSRIRLLSVYHHVKLYKSDLQGKSDSAFYSTADSTIRLYVNPIIWTQGSQLSGDTVNLQMKNKKMDNMELYPNGFIVNIEKTDSVHFNQVAGKKMRGFFKDDKLSRMFIDGNAETIYFARDSDKVTEMQRSLSSRIRINFKDNQVNDLTFLAKPEHRYGPLDKFTEDDKVLKGFIWKPKERPVSKESIIPSLGKNKSVKSTKSKTGATNKTKSKSSQGAKATKGNKIALNQSGTNKTVQDSLLNKNQTLAKIKKDTTINKPSTADTTKKRAIPTEN